MFALLARRRKTQMHVNFCDFSQQLHTSSVAPAACSPGAPPWHPPPTPPPELLLPARPPAAVPALRPVSFPPACAAPVAASSRLSNNHRVHKVVAASCASASCRASLAAGRPSSASAAPALMLIDISGCAAAPRLSKARSGSKCIWSFDFAPPLHRAQTGTRKDLLTKEKPRKQIRGKQHSTH